MGSDQRSIVDGSEPSRRALRWALREAAARGRGGFAGLLLGSVSQQCAGHAPCRG